MPLNGSGAYSLPSPAFPAVPNTLITASDFNTTLSDIAAALSQCVFRDGQAAFTAPQSMGNKKLTSLAAGTANTDAVNKRQLLDLFPIGAVYITAGNTNPGTFLGGTWVQIAQGRTLIGVGTLGTDTYAAGGTGGAARVALTTTEMPSHNHVGLTKDQSHDHTHTGYTDVQGVHSHSVTFEDGIVLGIGAGSGTHRISDGQLYGNGANKLITQSSGEHAHNIQTYGTSNTHAHEINPEGGGATHENRMPYLAVYFWQRTA